jgi:hypothetical protein
MEVFYEEINLNILPGNFYKGIHIFPYKTHARISFHKQPDTEDRLGNMGLCNYAKIPNRIKM